MAKQKKKTVVISPFGELTHVVGDLWEQPVRLTFLGRPVAATIVVSLAKKNPVPEPEQVAAFQTYAADPLKFIAAAEKTLRDAYKAELAADGRITLES